jgi:hypothetical protein
LTKRYKTAFGRQKPKFSPSGGGGGDPTTALLGGAVVSLTLSEAFAGVLFAIIVLRDLELSRKYAIFNQIQEQNVCAPLNDTRPIIAALFIKERDVRAI